MRILIAARHSPTGPRPIGGVQSWSATVGAELIKRGHEIVFWQPGFTLIDLFDFGILANYGDTAHVAKMCHKHIVICHGIIAPEKPPARNVAFTSEQVQKFWKVDGPIIRQPINLEFWHPIDAQLKTGIVRFSYRDGLMEGAEAAVKLGLPYVHIKNETQEDALNVLQKANCVIATGRAAVEAMACGVPVVIADHRHYQGPLLDPYTLGSMARNYSGRGGLLPTTRNMIEAINKAIALGNLRSHVEKYHDVKNIVNQLLEMV